ncbi:VHS1125 protein [Vibrio phage 1]|nr:VHS1125 protein [Vibrio phage 1]
MLPDFDEDDTEIKPLDLTGWIIVVLLLIALACFAYFAPEQTMLI